MQICFSKLVDLFGEDEQSSTLGESFLIDLSFLR